MTMDAGDADDFLNEVFDDNDNGKNIDKMDSDCNSASASACISIYRTREKTTIWANAYACIGVNDNSSSNAKSSATIKSTAD